MKKTILALILGLSLVACNAFAITTSTSTIYTFADNWKDWNSSTSVFSFGDENGTPKIDHMDVTVNAGGFLQSVDIVLHTSTYRQAFDSLFINSYNIETTNSAWDDWDYFVHDGGDRAGVSTGTVATNGFYSVKSGFVYTLTTTNRKNNPNGIDAYSLNQNSRVDFGATQDDYVIDYNLANFNIDVSDGFFVAYAPWCDNDIIGGGTAPVPEPATMVLLGSGLVGLAFYRRKMKK